MNNLLTLQFEGRRYLPVTYCIRECFASGAKDGWVMAAKVTNPAIEIDTTSMPPTKETRASSLFFQKKKQNMRCTEKIMKILHFEMYEGE